MKVPGGRVSKDRSPLEEVQATHPSPASERRPRQSRGGGGEAVAWQGRRDGASQERERERLFQLALWGNSLWELLWIVLGSRIPQRLTFELPQPVICVPESGYLGS